MRFFLLGLLVGASVLSSCRGDDGSTGDDGGVSVDAGPARDAGPQPVVDAGSTVDAGGSPFDAGTSDLAYQSADDSLQLNGTTRTFVVSRPVTLPQTALPVVIVFHGDGGNGRGIQAAFRFEASSREPMLYVYPDAPGGTFEYYSSMGRATEEEFVANLLNHLRATFLVDDARVYLAGMSGGATLANALGCRLSNQTIRAVGIHSGTLYPVDDDFTYTASGAVSCALPASIFVWGAADMSEGVSFAQGQATRDNYEAAAQCGNTSSPWTLSPCTRADSCMRDVVWCPIEGLGHAVWPGAADVMNAFFSTQK